MCLDFVYIVCMNDMCDNSIKCTLKFRGLSLYASFLFRSDEGLLQLYDIINLDLFVNFI